MLILCVHMFVKKAVQAKVGISSLALLEKILKYNFVITKSESIVSFWVAEDNHCNTILVTVVVKTLQQLSVSYSFYSFIGA